MKKLLFILFAVCAIGAHAQYSGSGNGTESDPYLIYNETQLYQMNNFLGSSNAGVVFKLMKDLDLTDFISENYPSEGWLPIGVSSSTFQGKFYGNNHKISGLSINRGSTSGVGFFGNVYNATIQDLTIEASTVTGNLDVGILAGNAKVSIIKNCTVSATKVTANSNYAGGAIGYVGGNTRITDCNVTTDVYAPDCSAGLIGNIGDATIKNVAIAGNVTGGQTVAGIIGLKNGTVSVENASFTGSVNGTGVYVAGAVAYCNTGNIVLKDINVDGDVSGAGTVGGILGISGNGQKNSFTNCHHKGKITNSGDATGGIVAYCNGQSIESMETCSHFGDITGKNYVGGLVGHIYGNPESRPVYYGSDSRTTNTKSWGPSTSTVVAGKTIAKIINNCTAIGNLSGKDYVGGLFGKEENGISYTVINNIPYSNNNNGGTVGTTSSYITRYLWRNNSYTGCGCYYYFSPVDTLHQTYIDITNSYYSGNIEGANYVGGVAGYKEGGSIQKCYTYASSIQGAKYVGGIAGCPYGKMIDQATIRTYLYSNVAINSTVSATTGDVHRIIGFSNSWAVVGNLGTKDGNRALTSTKIVKQGVVQEITDDLNNGNAMGSSLLKLKANYVALGWDFDNYWDIQETECYPYKKYQAAPPVIESNLVSQETTISGSSYNGGSVYLFYKDRDAVSTTCNGNNWSFSTEPLQSGASVQLYAEAAGMTPSYYTSTTVGYPGSGTEADPYRIYTAEDLQGASNKGYYKLMNDIDLTAWINENSPTEGWVSIGRNSGEATYINGDGHKITGLWINTTQNYTGLFSNFSAGVIKNLTVEVANGKKVKGGDYTGILIGRNTNGQILNCTVKGDVEGTAHVGGVTGYSANNTINAVEYEGTVSSATNGTYIGGFTGISTNDAISAAHTAATISATGEKAYAGGIVGHMNGGTLTKSHADADVTATGAKSYVGGLIGRSNAAISLSYVSGEITCTGDSAYTGGLVGYAEAGATIANSYSTAHVTGTLYTAGICAYTFSSINNCYASGNIDGARYGAGIVGQLDGTGASLNNSIAANSTLTLTDQSSWGCRVVQGFNNGAAEPASTNFALNTMQVSLNGVPQKKTDDPVEGIAKEESVLKSKDFYTGLGWDFNTVWAITDGGYPFLVWEHMAENIALSKDAIILKAGLQETITATVSPDEAVGISITWSSSDNAVATVNNGVVTAVSPGTAIITASAEDGSGVTATCSVKVVKNLDNAIAELQLYLDSAQTICDNIVEGINLDEYATGAQSALQSVIDEVNATMSATMDEETINEGNTKLDAALAELESKRVTSTNIDYSTVSDIIYINNVSSASDTQITVPVILNNSNDVSDIQFDMVLPTGVTIAKDEDDFEIIEVGERTTDKKHTIDCLEQSDGSVRIMCTSSKGYTFEGNSGTALLVTLNIPQMDDGDYELKLKNCISSNADHTYRLPNTATTLSIINFVLGDINGDGNINVGDLSRLVKMILNDYTTVDNVFKAADINGDGTLNVGDYSKLVQMILNAPAAGSKAFHGSVLSKSYMAGFSTMEAEDVNITSDRAKQIAIRLNNNGGKFNALQFDVTLPEGLQIDENATETAARTSGFDVTTNGKRVILSNIRDKAIDGEEGVILYLGLKADYGLVGGTNKIEFNNVLLSTVNSEVVKANDFSSAITEEPTGINNVPSSILDTQSIYDLQGRKVKSTSGKGIFIINKNKKKINTK